MKTLVFGGTGVLGGKVVLALSRKLDEDIFFVGQTVRADLEGHNRAKGFYFDLSNPGNYQELLSALGQSEIINVVWSVSPTVKVESQKSWFSSTLIDKRELELFKVFCSFVIRGEIKVGSIVIVSSASVLSASQRRGIWGYAAGKVLIQMLAEELLNAKKFNQLDFIFPSIFASKCSDDLRRLMCLNCDDQLIEGYVDEILGYLSLSS